MIAMVSWEPAQHASRIMKRTIGIRLTLTRPMRRSLGRFAASSNTLRSVRRGQPAAMSDTPHMTRSSKHVMKMTLTSKVNVSQPRARPGQFGNCRICDSVAVSAWHETNSISNLKSRSRIFAGQDASHSRRYMAEMEIMQVLAQSTNTLDRAISEI